MSVNQTDLADNTATRLRYQALLTQMSDDDLQRPLGEGWTVAATLAHIAFWDQRALRLLEKWEKHGVTPSPLPEDVDAVNDATQALCLALPPRAAAQLMLDTAEALDKKIEGLPPEFVAAIAAAGQHVGFGRWHHRREHLEELEKI
jgi:hypothetical protein